MCVCVFNVMQCKNDSLSDVRGTSSSITIQLLHWLCSIFLHMFVVCRLSGVKLSAVPGSQYGIQS